MGRLQEPCLEDIGVHVVIDDIVAICIVAIFHLRDELLAAGHQIPVTIQLLQTINNQFSYHFSSHFSSHEVTVDVFSFNLKNISGLSQDCSLPCYPQSHPHPHLHLQK
jgi:hypothetical protein